MKLYFALGISFACYKWIIPISKNWLKQTSYEMPNLLFIA